MNVAVNPCGTARACPDLPQQGWKSAPPITRGPWFEGAGQSRRDKWP